MNRPILVVDDEQDILKSVKGTLLAAGFDSVLVCDDGRQVLSLIREHNPSVVLLDLTMPYVSGQELLKAITAEHPHIQVIIITGVDDVSTAVECMRQGALDYLVKAVDNTTLIGAVRRAKEIASLRAENQRLKQGLLYGTAEHPEAFQEFLTADERMQAVFRYLEIIAPTGRPLFISGETGTGKELLAEAVHRLSGRSGDLVKINVAGLDDTMFSDTLFGHRKGAFSGALENRKGLVESAAGGTLFLDEIGDLSMQNQIKLLRLLENGEYYTLGSDVPKRSLCGVVTATNRDAEELFHSGQFRSDLYYRLAAHAVVLPPLRSRGGDIIPLAEHFLHQACAELKKPVPGITEEGYDTLLSHSWPGNVRELKSVIFDAASRSVAGVLEIHLPGSRRPPAGKGQSVPEPGDRVVFGSSLPTLKHCDEMLIREALHRTEGNITRAAELLGISQPALSKRLSRGSS